MRDRVVRCVVLLAVVGVLLTPGPVGRAAPPPTCGSTITRNTALYADLNCSGNALTIGKSGVTLNLNGHKIHGTSGIGVSTSYSRVTIENGSVTGFLAGVSIGGTKDRVRNMKLFDNFVGLTSSGARGSVTDTRMYLNTQYGLLVTAGYGTTFVRDTFIDNTGANVDGAVLEAPASFYSSFFTGNGRYGAVVNSDAAGSVFDSNYFNDNVLDGVTADGTQDVTFRRNIANFNGNWGINADPSVIDGGGNAARANGQSKQCSFVSCE